MTQRAWLRASHGLTPMNTDHEACFGEGVGTIEYAVLSAEYSV